MKEGFFSQIKTVILRRTSCPKYIELSNVTFFKLIFFKVTLYHKFCEKFYQEPSLTSNSFIRCTIVKQKQKDE